MTVQDLGHQAVLIIGDFTAMIGDPSGRSVTRPQLTHEQVLENARSYQEQAMKILDPARSEIVFNGEWFKKMSFHEVLQLNSRVTTLQQILQRESFRARLDQAGADSTRTRFNSIRSPRWDSVMKCQSCDVELGGTDQLFNNLVGRDLQKEQGMPQQVVLLLPILEGLDGVKKMSKSLGNHIALNETPNEMFGKLLSISDEMMARYYPLLLSRELPAAMHPLEAKKQLALEITATYHSREAAQKALDNWNHRFSEKRLSDATLPEFSASQRMLVNWWRSWRPFTEKGFRTNNHRTDLRRLITQGRHSDR